MWSRAQCVTSLLTICTHGLRSRDYVNTRDLCNLILSRDQLVSFNLSVSTVVITNYAIGT